MKKPVVLFIVVGLLCLLGLWWWNSREEAPPEEGDWGVGGSAVRDVPEAIIIEPEAPFQPQVQASQPLEDDATAPVTATAEITRGDGTIMTLESVDHEFEPLYVEANEPLQLRITLHEGRADIPVHLEADNGGILNRSMGSVDVPLVDGKIEFEYILGGNTGKYTVYASQGNRQELLEFRVGSPPQIGASGPPRHFQPDYLTH